MIIINFTRKCKNYFNTPATDDPRQQCQSKTLEESWLQRQCRHGHPADPCERVGRTTVSECVEPAHEAESFTPLAVFDRARDVRAMSSDPLGGPVSRQVLDGNTLPVILWQCGGAIGPGLRIIGQALGSVSGPLAACVARLWKYECASLHRV